jgi:hypothetical protein
MFQFLEEARLTTPVHGLRLAADMSYPLDVYAPLACISLSLSVYTLYVIYVVAPYWGSSFSHASYMYYPPCGDPRLFSHVANML